MPRFLIDEMIQRLALLVALPGLLLAGSLAALATQSHLDPGVVYSIAAIRAHLSHHSSAWLGRPVLVRGVLTGCAHRVLPGHEPCFPPVLIDSDHPGAVDPLLAAWKAPDSVWVYLRRVPLLGTLVPSPQVLHWDEVATYRVQLRTAHIGACPSLPCYEALLVDVVGLL